MRKSVLKNVIKSFSQMVPDAIGEEMTGAKKIVDFVKDPGEGESVTGMLKEVFGKYKKDAQDVIEITKGWLKQAKTGKLYDRDAEEKAMMKAMGIDDADFNMDFDDDDLFGDAEDKKSKKKSSDDFGDMDDFNMDDAFNVDDDEGASKPKKAITNVNFVNQSNDVDPGNAITAVVMASASSKTTGAVERGTAVNYTMLHDIDARLQRIEEANNTYYATSLELLGSIKSNIEGMAKANALRDTNLNSSQIERLFGDGSGEFNTNLYIKGLQKKFEDVTQYEMLSMAKNMFSPSMIIKMGIGELFKKIPFMETIKKLSDMTEGIGQILLNSMANVKGNGAIAKLFRFFGVRSSTKLDITNSGAYEKGPVPFDGITRRSIVHVIPELLAKIHKAITKSDEELSYDWDKGKMSTVSKKQTNNLESIANFSWAQKIASDVVDNSSEYKSLKASDKLKIKTQIAATIVSKLNGKSINELMKSDGSKLGDVLSIALSKLDPAVRLRIEKDAKAHLNSISTVTMTSENKDVGFGGSADEIEDAERRFDYQFFLKKIKDLDGIPENVRSEILSEAKKKFDETKNARLFKGKRIDYFSIAENVLKAKQLENQSKQLTSIFTNDVLGFEGGINESLNKIESEADYRRRTGSTTRGKKFKSEYEKNKLKFDSKEVGLAVANTLLSEYDSFGDFNEEERQNKIVQTFAALAMSAPQAAATYWEAVTPMVKGLAKNTFNNIKGKAWGKVAEHIGEFEEEDKEAHLFRRTMTSAKNSIFKTANEGKDKAAKEAYKAITSILRDQGVEPEGKDEKGNKIYSARQVEDFLDTPLGEKFSGIKDIAKNKAEGLGVSQFLEDFNAEGIQNLVNGGKRSGGYTGNAPTNRITGFVHGNEYVVPARVLNTEKGSRLVSQLESMRIPGYAEGGVVDPNPVMRNPEMLDVESRRNRRQNMMAIGAAVNLIANSGGIKSTNANVNKMAKAFQSELQLSGSMSQSKISKKHAQAIGHAYKAYIEAGVPEDRAIIAAAQTGIVEGTLTNIYDDVVLPTKELFLGVKDDIKSGKFTSDDVMKALPGAAKGAGVGLAASFFLPGGPLLGALAGGVIGASKQNETIHSFFIGKKDANGNITKNGMIPNVTKSLIGALFGKKAGENFDKNQKAFISNPLDFIKTKASENKGIAGGLAAGGLVGSFFGPNGALIGALMGGGVGSIAQKKFVQRLLFGKKLENGYTGGIYHMAMGAFNAAVATPINWFFFGARRSDFINEKTGQVDPKKMWSSFKQNSKKAAAIMGAGGAIGGLISGGNPLAALFGSAVAYAIGMPNKPKQVVKALLFGSDKKAEGNWLGMIKRNGFLGMIKSSLFGNKNEQQSIIARNGGIFGIMYKGVKKVISGFGKMVGLVGKGIGFLLRKTRIGKFLLGLKDKALGALSKGAHFIGRGIGRIVGFTGAMIGGVGTAVKTLFTSWYGGSHVPLAPVGKALIEAVNRDPKATTGDRINALVATGVSKLIDIFAKNDILNKTKQEKFKRAKLGVYNNEDVKDSAFDKFSSKYDDKDQAKAEWDLLDEKERKRLYWEEHKAFKNEGRSLEGKSFGNTRLGFFGRLKATWRGVGAEVDAKYAAKDKAKAEYLAEKEALADAQKSSVGAVDSTRDKPRENFLKKLYRSARKSLSRSWKNSEADSGDRIVNPGTAKNISEMAAMQQVSSQEHTASMLAKISKGDGGVLNMLKGIGSMLLSMFPVAGEFLSRLPGIGRLFKFFRGGPENPTLPKAPPKPGDRPNPNPNPNTPKKPGLLGRAYNSAKSFFFGREANAEQLALLKKSNNANLAKMTDAEFSQWLKNNNYHGKQKEAMKSLRKQQINAGLKGGLDKGSKNIFGRLKDWGSDKLNKAKDALGSAKASTESWWSRAKKWGSNKITNLKNAALDTGRNIRDWGASKMREASEWAKGKWNGLKDWGKAKLETLKSVKDKLMLLKPGELVKKLTTFIKEGFGSIWRGIVASKNVCSKIPVLSTIFVAIEEGMVIYNAGKYDDAKMKIRTVFEGSMVAFFDALFYVVLPMLGAASGGVTAIISGIIGVVDIISGWVLGGPSVAEFIVNKVIKPTGLSDFIVNVIYELSYGKKRGNTKDPNAAKEAEQAIKNSAANEAKKNVSASSSSCSTATPPTSGSSSIASVSAPTTSEKAYWNNGASSAFNFVDLSSVGANTSNSFLAEAARNAMDKDLNSSKDISTADLLSVFDITTNNLSTSTLTNLDPDFKRRIYSVAMAYQLSTGKKLKVNDGYRDIDGQLGTATDYLKYKWFGVGHNNGAAYPGRSPHGAGKAMDIDTSIVQEIGGTIGKKGPFVKSSIPAHDVKSDSLLAKAGLHLPYLKPAVDQDGNRTWLETWHVGPMGNTDSSFVDSYWKKPDVIAKRKKWLKDMLAIAKEKNKTLSAAAILAAEKSHSLKTLGETGLIDYSKQNEDLALSAIDKINADSTVGLNASGQSTKPAKKPKSSGGKKGKKAERGDGNEQNDIIQNISYGASEEIMGAQLNLLARISKLLQQISDNTLAQSTAMQNIEEDRNSGLYTGSNFGFAF